MKPAGKLVGRVRDAGRLLEVMLVMLHASVVTRFGVVAKAVRDL